MNEYVYPICFVNSELCKIEYVTANNHNDAYDKIIQKYMNKYESLESDDWEEFIEEIKQKENIIIGLVEDIETL